ncbi:MAG TPA: conjugal transfer protein TraE [Lachnospiraceae bacterium]|nr:conjugal transfer protein TraE [Lachnospiraceae bacterium]
MKMGESPREADKKPFDNNNQITQNVKDLLRSTDVEVIFENTDFIIMLNQGPGDARILQEKLEISVYQMKYVVNVTEGRGLLFYGDRIIPFYDDFPKDTTMYKIMTTKFDEVNAG